MHIENATEDYIFTRESIGFVNKFSMFEVYLKYCM